VAAARLPAASVQRAEASRGRGAHARRAPQRTRCCATSRAPTRPVRASAGGVRGWCEQRHGGACLRFGGRERRCPGRVWCDLWRRGWLGRGKDQTEVVGVLGRHRCCSADSLQRGMRGLAGCAELEDRAGDAPGGRRRTIFSMQAGPTVDARGKTDDGDGGRSRRGTRAPAPGREPGPEYGQIGSCAEMRAGRIEGYASAASEGVGRAGNGCVGSVPTVTRAPAPGWELGPGYVPIGLAAFGCRGRGPWPVHIARLQPSRHCLSTYKRL
jgi:hypothetical protein